MAQLPNLHTLLKPPLPFLNENIFLCEEFNKVDNHKILCVAFTVRVSIFGGKTYPEQLFFSSVQVFDSQRALIIYVHCQAAGAAGGKFRN